MYKFFIVYQYCLMFCLELDMQVPIYFVFSVHSWVFSKKRDVDADFFDKIDKVFEKNEIPEYDYFKVIQNNCPT